MLVNITFYEESNMEKRPLLGILLGDGSGVGSEIVAKLAVANFFEKYCKPIVIGDARILERGFSIIGSSVPVQIISTIEEADWSKGLPLLDQKNLSPDDAPLGELSALCGKAVLDMLSMSIQLFKEGKIEGFCFAPLNKASMKMAGSDFEGDIPLMANMFGFTGLFGEINVQENVWSTRVTSHIPMKEVSEHITEENIIDAVQLADITIRRAGIEKPRLAIAAYNPHAGENGLCGREEVEIIGPTIEKIKEMGIDASGPYAGDTIFVRAFAGDYDGVVSMYHDQGQIAFKLKGFETGVSIAGGLPAPIVTCAHGTAFDIVGTGVVKTSAFEHAVEVASMMALNQV
jgi:4-hydroxy-L-threonine phosphate dehydrogenase PdxA